MKALPITGNELTPESHVGLDVLVDLIKLKVGKCYFYRYI